MWENCHDKMDFLKAMENYRQLHHANQQMALGGYGNSGMWAGLLGSSAGAGAGPHFFCPVGQSEPDEDGWYNWELQPPPRGKLIQVWRKEWDKPFVCYKHEVDSQTNVIGLKWRLTGIGKETK